MKLETDLRGYVQSGYYPFHMPGHKRNPEFFSLREPFSVDLTELDDTDDLHCASGILLAAMNRASEVFSARRTFFLTGGSTSGILSAVYALSKRGAKVLVARNCHKSVYNAVCLNKLEPVYVCPPAVEKFGFCGSVTPEAVKAAFECNPGICLAVITSPTYEGVVSDIASIADIVHSYGAVLLVDEAHGAHLGFNAEFPESAVRLGADVVVQSLHKTLPCFTQTALLHICTERVDEAEIESALQMFETSSPSYVLMCGIDNCVSILQERSRELFSAYARRLSEFSQACANLKHLSVFGCGADNCKNYSQVFARDPSKLNIFAGAANISGRGLYRVLKERYKLQLEMYTADSALAVTSICDTDSGFHRLISALLETDERISAYSGFGRQRFVLPLPKQKMLPYTALESEKKFIAPSEAVGKTAAGFVYAYPPGVPLLAAGEEITREAVKSVLSLKAQGVNIQGAGIEKDGKICVVK